jgi:beta-barrel assembly-enhancing protease
MNPEELRFEATVSHPDHGEAPIPGAVRFTRFAMRFEADPVKVEFPLEGMKLEWRRTAASPEIVLTHPRLPGWVVCSEEAALEHPAFTQRTHLRDQLAATLRGRETRRRWLICGAFLGVFAVVSLIGWGLSGFAVNQVVARIPVEMEAKLGEKVFAEVKQVWRVDVSESAELTRLRGLQTRLATALPDTGHDIRLHLVHDSTANAFALPGGRILVTTGLIRLADNDDELASVLAHELAHVRHRHSLRQIVSAGGPALVARALAGDESGLAGALSVGFEFLVSQRFSRAFEREADDSGWDYLVAAGIDPRGMIRMMHKFREEENRLGALAATTAQPMNSHPATGDRIRRLEARWKQLPDKERFTQASGSSGGR